MWCWSWWSPLLVWDRMSTPTVFFHRPPTRQHASLQKYKPGGHHQQDQAGAPTFCVRENGAVHYWGADRWENGAVHVPCTIHTSPELLFTPSEWKTASLHRLLCLCPSNIIIINIIIFKSVRVFSKSRYAVFKFLVTSLSPSLSPCGMWRSIGALYNLLDLAAISVWVCTKWMALKEPVCLDVPFTDAEDSRKMICMMSAQCKQTKHFANALSVELLLVANAESRCWMFTQCVWAMWSVTGLIIKGKMFNNFV